MTSCRPATTDRSSELTRYPVDEIAPAHSGLTPDELRAIYAVMLLARALDDRQSILNRQGRQGIHLSARGHEASGAASQRDFHEGLNFAFRRYPCEHGLLDVATDAALAGRALGAVDEALALAEQTPVPAPETALEHVYAGR